MSTDRAAGPIHVLALAADRDYAESMASQLAASEFRVTTVASANEAMETLSTASDVECIVSDHDLPDVDCVAFLQAVRAEHPDLPFIVFTSEGSEEVASRAIHARATDYLIKEEYGDQWGRLATLIERAVEYFRVHREAGDSEGRARPLFDAMPDMVGVLRDGEFVYVNGEGVGLLGVEGPDDLIGRGLLDLFVEENDLTREKLVAIQSGEAYIGAVGERLVDASGVPIPVDLTLSRINWRGEPAVLVVVTDRSERASLEHRLKKLARINAVIREVNHLIISADTREEIEAGVCERFAAADPYRLAWIGGYDPEAEVVEPRVWAGFEAGYLDGVEITVEGDKGGGPIGLAIKTREPQVTADIAEDSLFHPSWREEAMDRGYRSSAAIPLVSNGTLYGVLNLYANRPNAFHGEELEVLEILAGDVAFAIRALEDREELERSEERLSLALDAANAGVWDWLMDQEEVIWDERVERLFGLDPGEFEGTYEGFAKRVDPEDLPAVRRTIDRAIDRSGRFESEFRIRRDDGGERWIAAVGKTLTDDAGEPIRLIGVNVDITERKEREQHMRVIDRVLRHNLRNDLNVIEGNATTIRERTTGRTAQLAERITTRCEKLLRTADKERAIVEVLTERPTYEEIDLAALVERTAETMRKRHPEARIDVDAPGPTTASVIDCFDVAMEELVENAVVHNDRERPEVAVTVEHVDGGVAIRVADDGPAIPEMNVAVLTAESEEPLYHGSGLGLWLVHWIVRGSDGTLDFEERESRGNAVTITLPGHPGTEGRG